MNAFYTVMYGITLVGAVVWYVRTPSAEILPTLLIVVGAGSGIALFQCMANLVLIVHRIGNPITSTEDEIRTANESGPQ